MTSASQYADNSCQTSVTILSGATASSEADLHGTTLVGIMLPATMTGTALTFGASLISGGTFASVRDGAGSAISKTMASGQYISIDPTLFRGIRFLKVTSGSTEGADRAITLISKRI